VRGPAGGEAAAPCCQRPLPKPRCTRVWVADLLLLGVVHHCTRVLAKRCCAESARHRGELPQDGVVGAQDAFELEVARERPPRVEIRSRGQLSRRKRDGLENLRSPHGD
jgi:hypothetical protein